MVSLGYVLGTWGGKIHDTPANRTYTLFVRNNYLPLPVLPILHFPSLSYTGHKNVAFFYGSDLMEPLGATLWKKWGRKVYHGVLLDRSTEEDGEDGEPLLRGIYTDGEVHDFPIYETSVAIAAARIPCTTPCIKLELYDESTSPEQMGNIVTEDEDGNFTIKYKPIDKPDFDSPLGMALATDDGSGMMVGMGLSRITSDGEHPIQYRVSFCDGGGWVLFEEEIRRMRKVFLETPGLKPITVTVIGVNMS